MSHRPHLWVPYPYFGRDGEAEICTFCGEFQTPENAAADCPETLLDELAPIPADMTDTAEIELADGTDDELRQGAIRPTP